MLPRSRTLVVATIVVLISIALLTLVGNTPPEQVSAAAPAQGTVAPTAIIQEGQSTSKAGFGRDARIGTPGYDTLEKELNNTLFAFKVDTDKTPASKFFDLEAANYAINSDTGALASITAGLCNSGSADKTTFDRNTPDGNHPSATIIGAVYAPFLVDDSQKSLGENAMVLVYVKGAPQPLRFYVNDQQVTLKSGIKFVERHFVGVPATTPRIQTPPKCSSGQNTAPQTNVNRPTEFDEGTISKAGETCFTVGLTQECYQYTPTNSKAVQEVKDAYQRFQTANNKSNLFPNFNQIKFDFAGAVADIKGDKQRQKCARKNDKELWSKEELSDNCQATVYFAGLTGYTNIKQVPTLGGNTPYANATVVGFLRVEDVNGLILDSNNNPDFPHGLIDKTDPDGKITEGVTLPMGDYVWLDTGSSVLAGGSSTLLEVDANGVSYQHPAYHLEAFGNNPANSTLSSLDPRLPAYIKDGGSSGTGCP